MDIIKDFAITYLNNGDYYQFIESVSSIVQKEPLVTSLATNLSGYIPLLQKSYKKEQLTLETKEVMRLDALRDRAYTHLCFLVDAQELNDEIPGNSTAAQKIKSITKRYKNGALIRFDYNKESASLTNFIKDLREQAAPELQQINLGSVLDFLELKNNDFIGYYASRGDLQTQINNIVPMGRLRKEVTPAYRKLVTNLQSAPEFIPNSEAAVQRVIDRLNAEIDKYALLIPKNNKNPDTPAKDAEQE